MVHPAAFQIPPSLPPLPPPLLLPHPPPQVQNIPFIGHPLCQKECLQMTLLMEPHLSQLDLPVGPLL